MHVILIESLDASMMSLCTVPQAVKELDKRFHDKMEVEQQVLLRVSQGVRSVTCCLRSVRCGM
jgi:hypothetical protein